jgi:hypothetical protein
VKSRFFPYSYFPYYNASVQKEGTCFLLHCSEFRTTRLDSREKYTMENSIKKGGLRIRVRHQDTRKDEMGGT